MFTFLVVLHVLIAVLMVVVILMQSSKGGGLAGAFGGAGGGGGSQSLFGGRGAASFLQKLTVALAIIFMLLAIAINLIGRGGTQQRSVVREAAQEGELSPGTSLPKPGEGQSGEGLLPVEQEGMPTGTQQDTGSQ